MKKTYEQMTAREKVNYSICKNHTGKMTGIWSISTSPLCNEFCRARCNAENSNMICSNCYAVRMMNTYPTLASKLERNTGFYMAHYVTPKEVPVFKTKYGRFESFGDLNNLVQVYNYMMIASIDADVNFGLWTKNVFLLVAYVKAGGVIPKNVTINISSVYKNTAIPPEELEGIRKTVPVDHVFTVYETEEDAKKAGVKINCGKKNCNTCGLCYNHNSIDYINELLK